MDVHKALALAGPDAVLSHVTAVSMWGMSDIVGNAPVHVDVPAARRARSTDGVVVHRRKHAGASVEHQGLLVRPLEESLVDSWSWLTRRPDQTGRLNRFLVIESVRRCLTTPGRLLLTADRRGDVAGRAELMRLTALLLAGCPSELELWGYDRVFTGDGLPRFHRCVPVVVDGRTFVLDLVDPNSGVNVELDSWQWQATLADRERDLRRDAVLRAAGFQVVRYAGSAMYQDPESVRADLKQQIATTSRNLVAVKATIQ